MIFSIFTIFIYPLADEDLKKSHSFKVYIIYLLKIIKKSVMTQNMKAQYIRIHTQC